MRTPRPSRRSAAAFLGGVAFAAIGIVVAWRPGASASAAPGVRAMCSASVDVIGGSTPPSIFQSAFTVTSERRHAEDRSSGLRDETFTASVVGDQIELAYVKDTSPTESVRLEITLTFVGDRGVQAGRSVFTAAGQPDRVATYAATCRR